MLHVSRSVTVNRPRRDVYEFWRQLENLPRFMRHVEDIRPLGGGRSHWIVSGPAGRQIEWDAEIVADEPAERLAWRTLPGSDVAHEGSVRFRDAPAGRGTEIEVALRYDAPGGGAGASIARLFGQEPSQQIRDDLRRLKQVLETGEVVLSDGSLEGAGQGLFKQRAAQPADGSRS